MSSVDICWLCDGPIAEINTKGEHIIPNAIGGRRTLKGFLCSKCNRSTGSTWDAALAKNLNYFGLLFETKRQRGNVPPMTATTAAGDELTIQGGNIPTIAKPTHRVTRDEKGGVRLEISARSRKEARDMLEGFKRKYPQLDVDEALNSRHESGTYSSDPYGIDFGGSSDVDRSIVKSGVALACEAGLTPRDCDLAMEYLRNEEKDYDDNGLWHYYQRDLVKNREIGLPLHCVYITGSPRSSLLLAYVEYYGVVRRVICLSKGYEKKTFSRVYSVNPVSGKEISDVEIQLDASVFNVVMTQTPEELVAGLTKALNQVMASGVRLSRCRAIARICVARVDGYCERRNLVMTKDDRQNLVEEVAQSLVPLIEHYLTPLKFPEGFDPAKQ